MKRVLVWLMLGLFLPLCARADADGFVRSASFAIPSAWGAQYAQLPLDESWFLEENTQYHHGLARISLAMAVSAFRNGGDAPDGLIRSFFEQLGFSASHDPDGSLLPVQTWDYPAPAQETIGTAVAWRYLTCFESPIPLIAVAVCGGNYGEEWANSLDFGLSGDHAGFQRAAQTVLERVRTFERENGLEGIPCRYWLAGYGRGGAVCNIAAAALEKEAAGRVFCYTFASPMTTVSREQPENSGIFNLVSSCDILAQLPPASWGFARYGRTLYFPSARASGSAYPALARQFDAVYSQFTGSNAASETDPEPMAEAALRQLTKEFGSRTHYQTSYQQLLYQFFTSQSLGMKNMLTAASLMRSVGNAAKKAQFGPLPKLPDGMSALRLFSSAELAALYLQHDPAVYASWMLALPEGSPLTDNALSAHREP